MELIENIKKKDPIIKVFFQNSVDINTKAGLFAVYYGLLFGLANFFLVS